MPAGEARPTILTITDGDGFTGRIHVKNNDTTSAKKGRGASRRQPRRGEEAYCTITMQRAEMILCLARVRMNEKTRKRRAENLRPETGAGSQTDGPCYKRARSLDEPTTNSARGGTADLSGSATKKSCGNSPKYTKKNAVAKDKKTKVSKQDDNSRI